jgi:hypothetical protein
MRRWLLRLLFLAVLIGSLVTIARRRRSGAEPVRPVWPPLDETEPSVAAAATAPTIPEGVPPSERWSEPVERACPPGFDVKVKLASGIYHLPGMFAYERAIPDRCYASAAAAEADGFRPAKR